MSQSGLIDIESSHPQIPTTFDGDSGSAIPIANLLTIEGLTVANGTYAKPVFVTASGATVVVNAQTSTARTGAPGDKLDAGLCSFDDTAFVVDADGYVSLTGGSGPAIDSITVDAITAPGVNPVGPDATGIVTVAGAMVAAHSVPIETRSRGLNAYNIEIQYASSIAAADGTKVGACSFDSSMFSVDASGFVQLAGGTVAVDSNTGDDVIAVFPDAVGNFDWLGQTVANLTHAKPVYFKDSVTPNAIDVDVQVAAAIFGSPADMNDAGLSSYNDTQLTVDANGYVELVGGTDLPVLQTLTSDDPTIVGPDVSGNIDVTGEAVANATNAKPVYVDAGANALNIETQVAAAVTGAPGDKNDAGLISLDDTHFTVDADGYTQIIGGVLSWVEETTVTRALLVNQGVLGTNIATITMTLPATAAQFDKFRFMQNDVGSIKIGQNAGQKVYFGNQSTTTGAGGSMESSAEGDSIELICTRADLDFRVLSSLGNWLIV